MEKLLSDNRLLIGGAAALVIIGALWFMTREATAPSMETSDTNMNTGETPDKTSDLNPGVAPSTTSDNEYIAVKDQLAGSTVTVDSVTFTQTGWVAIRDDRGWTLGAARFEAGTHDAVEVPLLRATEAGQRYQALLYIDDGDGKFDLDKEILVTRSGGSVAGMTFSVQ